VATSSKCKIRIQPRPGPGQVLVGRAVGAFVDPAGRPWFLSQGRLVRSTGACFPGPRALGARPALGLESPWPRWGDRFFPMESCLALGLKGLWREIRGVFQSWPGPDWGVPTSRAPSPMALRDLGSRAAIAPSPCAGAPWPGPPAPSCFAEMTIRLAYLSVGTGVARVWARYSHWPHCL
jgi:hypothetical protein